MHASPRACKPEHRHAAASGDAPHLASGGRARSATSKSAGATLSRRLAPRSGPARGLAPRSGPARGLVPRSGQARCGVRRDDDGVTEVVGQILMFGILAMVLVLSMLGFNVAKEGADSRVAEANAASLAQRVASAVVDVALFAETSEGGDLRMQVRLDLPEQVEGRSYTIELAPDEVTVTVSAVDRSSKAPLFASGTPAEVAICDQAKISGGPVFVRVSDARPTGCAGSSDLYVFLESAS